MISLKKFLEILPEESSPAPDLQRANPLTPHPYGPGTSDLRKADPFIADYGDAYRAALIAISDCGVQICPHLGEGLRRSLLGLRKRLSSDIPPSLVLEAREVVDRELKKWGGAISDYLREKVSDVKEVMLILARAAAAMSDRGQRATGVLGEFSTRLERMASLEDLGEDSAEGDQSFRREADHGSGVKPIRRRSEATLAL